MAPPYAFTIRNIASFVVGFIVVVGATPAPGETPQLTYAFSHLAGAPGGAGSDDGPCAVAGFSGPGGVAVDSAGNVYVADTKNSTIRKITSDGAVTTLAGAAGFVGNEDGAGAAARFNHPEGVAVDRAGNVYVGDTKNFGIRKISPDGVVTTLATQRFFTPSAVAVDDSGNVYAAQVDTIFKITSDGVITTLATGFGDLPLPAGASSLQGYPGALAVDGAGNVYFADAVSSVIRKIRPNGVQTILAGAAFQWGAVDGAGAVARFRSPGGIALDGSGNLYVGDTSNSTIRKITASGVVSTLAGGLSAGRVVYGNADGTGALASFRSPKGVAVDSAGKIYVADYENNLIRQITPAGVVSTLAGSVAQSGSVDGKGTAARFSSPASTAVDVAGNVYVADSVNSTIRKITPDGVVTTFAGSAGQQANVDGTGAAARFNRPGGIAVDRAGSVYVADTDNFTIRKITPEGVVTTLAGTPGQWGAADGMGPAARFHTPAAIAVDAAGNVYVNDLNIVTSSIRKIAPNGAVNTLAQLSSVYGLAVDAAGNLYVTQNQTVGKISSEGAYATLAGVLGQNGSTDGSGDTARFFLSPRGIAVDAAGNLYVTDTNNETIRKITPAGIVTTIGGSPGQIGYADGLGNAARFTSPQGIAVDQAGNLYFTDYNGTVRKGVPIGGGQIVNLSTRSLVGIGDNIQIAGFVITGNQPKQVLIRACGPALGTVFNLPGVLADPVLTLFDHTGAQINQNTNWSGDPEIRAAAQRVGAFAWPNPSADSALLVTLSPGSYTAQVTGKSGDSGTAMIEIYDADSTATGRLINISTRSPVSLGSNLQIGGFVVTGDHAKLVLIRAGGPVLGTAFKMAGALPDPVLTLMDHAGEPITQNTGWGTDAFAAELIRSTASRVGAFAWSAGSADSALLVTLSPGVYTAQVTGKSGVAGTALLEVYDADP